MGPVKRSRRHPLLFYEVSQGRLVEDWSCGAELLLLKSGLIFCSINGVNLSNFRPRTRYKRVQNGAKQTAEFPLFSFPAFGCLALYRCRPELRYEPEGREFASRRARHPGLCECLCEFLRVYGGFACTSVCDLVQSTNDLRNKSFIRGVFRRCDRAAF
jgi:hypothetical protein